MELPGGHSFPAFRVYGILLGILQHHRHFDQPNLTASGLMQSMQGYLHRNDHSLDSFIAHSLRHATVVLSDPTQGSPSLHAPSYFSFKLPPTPSLLTRLLAEPDTTAFM